MKITGNTIVVTGGGSGIGRCMSEALHAEGNQVIIAGRRQSALDEVTAANPGMKSLRFDVENPASIAELAEKLKVDFPALNAVFHNAGIMRSESIVAGSTNDAEAIININLLGPIRLTAALMPLLLAQPHATILTSTSGLAFVPLFSTPTYNATKAAIHSYTQSLRYQLRDTAVQVIEIAPPLVQTELMGVRQASNPNAMPLKEFVAEVMNLLKTQPDADEILVERVKAQRFAEASGRYDEFYKNYNDRMAALITL